MNNMISVIGSILIEDVVTALEPKLSDGAFEKLAAELRGEASSRLKLDDVEVKPEEALAALENVGKLPEPESLSYELDQGDVQDLAAAIRRGDRPEAELLLDRIFGHDTTVSEWVQRGRYGSKARAITEPARQAA